MEFKSSQVNFQTKNKFADEMKRFVVDEAARFTTEDNDAASATMDEMTEGAIRFSSEKNKRSVAEQKQILSEIKEKQKAMGKESSIHPSETNVSGSSYSKGTVSSNNPSYSKGSSDGFSSGSGVVQGNSAAGANIASTELGNSANREQLVALSEANDRFLDGVDSERFGSSSNSHSSDTRESARTSESKKDLEKQKEAAKAEKKAQQKKAATKTSVANMFRAKKDLANGLASDESSGNAMKDGMTGLMKTFADAVNPMRYVKALLAKLGAIVAPYIAVFMVVATIVMVILMFIFSVLQPIAEIGEAITNFLSVFSVESDTIRNTTLSQDEIDAIIEDSSVDEDKKAVLQFALSKVGYPYSQANRTSGSAYDCSSLAYYAWKEAGVDISYGSGYPPTAAAGAKMLKDDGKALSTMDLKPGDLVYYGGDANGRYLGIYHVAIYVGNGKAVEALNEKYGVVYQTLRTKNAIMVCRPS